MSEEKIRLQKFLSQQGICSRRQAETYIRERRVMVNDSIATLGDRVGESDEISLDGKVLTVKKDIKRVVVLFFKPKGVETTMGSVPGTKTIVDFDFGVGRVFPIGRLDKDSQGLLLLTNDGDLANKLAHPRYQKEKEYLVSVVSKEKVESIEVKAQKLSRGIKIDGRETQSCKVNVVQDDVLQFILKEGRNRQIRKMCEAVGLDVVDLLRVRVGKIKLGEMKPGKFRILSETEIGSL